MLRPSVFRQRAVGTVLAATGLGFFVLSVAATPAHAVAMIDPLTQARLNLKSIYVTRTDLQAAFGPDGVATPAMKAKGLVNIEDWACKYGINEYPALLFSFATGVPTPSAPVSPVVTGVTQQYSQPRALKERPAPYVPIKVTSAEFSPRVFTASSLMVIDDATRRVLLKRNADQQWPIASISKLMTAMVSLENGYDLSKTDTILKDDEVGGARLRVDNGVRLTTRELFDSMLVGSANNAANAVARGTGMSKEAFVAAMNARAKQMGLAKTHFADPTGIETENVSTAEGVAAIAFEALEKPAIQRATTTGQFTLEAASQTHTVKNTNWILTDPDNGLYVLGGKTGYLIESKWNFVVKMKDYRNRPLLVVVLGSSDRQQSFNDATAAAKWVWANYRWTK